MESERNTKGYRKAMQIATDRLKRLEKQPSSKDRDIMINQIKELMTQLEIAANIVNTHRMRMISPPGKQSNANLQKVLKTISRKAKAKLQKGGQYDKLMNEYNKTMRMLSQHMKVLKEEPPSSGREAAIEQTKEAIAKLEVAAKILKNQEKKGDIPSGKQTAENKKKINNYITRKAKEKLEINAYLEKLNHNIQAATAEHKKSLEEMKKAILNKVGKGGRQTRRLRRRND